MEWFRDFHGYRHATRSHDVHSQLNPTVPREVARPHLLAGLQRLVACAAARGLKVSVAGGRHDPGELFCSDWYLNYRDAFGLRAAPATGAASLERVA